ncbi:MAG: sugar phosphate isomerase/epimerase [Acidobacteria bacterium]|nr:sugar phosphate isomerase/epimerase [Acidobacteriota bacterium]
MSTTRRTFLALSALAAWNARAARLPIRKAVLLSMLPRNLSFADRLQLARDVGFEEIECPTTPDQRDAEEIKKAAEKAKLRIHSVMNMAHWRYPLSSADPAAVAESVNGMETSLRNANFWGAETVLLVPAVVNAQTSYADAWKRSQAEIRKLIPLAQKLKVIIAVEEVWNKFLQSPLEFARYVDEFQSPWVRAYFDVGNVVINGYPQDWIRTLGKRIVKLHIKDFAFKDRVAKFTALREGEIDWPAVHKALEDIGYTGSATVELPGGDKDYLQEVNRRFDLILSGV